MGSYPSLSLAEGDGPLEEGSIRFKAPGGCRVGKFLIQKGVAVIFNYRQQVSAPLFPADR
ncbi:MAG: hypothetical protein PF795_09585 [Kiritimatiellae bacterium]|nr:hypothetical protein [Kiritimatiellia bacterium]